MSREVQRAPVRRAQDPLQLSLTSPESWAIPDSTKAQDTSASSLQELASKGAWRAIAQQTASFWQYQAGADLQEAAWHVLAQTKLREYPAAQEALESLGDLDSKAYQEESDSGKGTSNTRVPFVLRVLGCELLIKLSRWKEGQDAYYRLLDLCKSRADQPQDPAHSDLWHQREERIVAILFTLHLRLKDYKAALEWIVWMLERHPQDTHLLSTAGCVQLNIGHTQAALTTFQEVAQMASGQSSPETGLRRLAQRNKGLLMLAQNNMTGALQEFKDIAAVDPKDAVAANNKAICEMYAGSLTEAVQSLEGSLQSEPSAMVHETILKNLGTMYDLYSPKAGQDSKQALSEWASHVAPDDFDLAFLQ